MYDVVYRFTKHLGKWTFNGADVTKWSLWRRLLAAMRKI